MIIGVSTLGLATILAYMGTFNIYSLAIMVVLFNGVQWLIAPYIVNSMYRVKRLDPEENPGLHQTINELSARSGIRTPKLMISSLPIPNAFAYGSPLTGNHVAVTDGLLSSLEGEEVEAVLAHELGHIKHRDVQVTMLISVLPSLFYILYRSTLFSRYRSRDRRDGGGLAAVGSISMLLYLGLMLFNLGFSRLREYYADQHAAGIVSDGARKLSEGLAKITNSTARHQMFTPGTKGHSSFKTLFISDPDSAVKDAAELNRANLWGSDEELVASIASRKITGTAKLAELFSTHPNIVKRIRALKG